MNQRFDIKNSDILFPEHQIEGIFDPYCSNYGEYGPRHNGMHCVERMYGCLAQYIEEKCFGDTEWDKEGGSLVCTVKTMRDRIKFGIRIFESRRWMSMYQMAVEEECDYLEDDGPVEPLYVIRFYRIEGDSYEFLKIRNTRLLVCADMMSGLNKKQRSIFRDMYDQMVSKTGNMDRSSDIHIHVIPQGYQAAYFTF